MVESVVDKYEDLVESVVSMFSLYDISEKETADILGRVFDLFKLRIKDEE